MGYNVEALTKLRDTIAREARLGKHDQGVWGRIKRSTAAVLKPFTWQGETYELSCPSSACAAGWTVTQAGAKMLFSRYSNDVVADYCLADGDVLLISDYAARILGLNAREESMLFAGDLSTETVLDYLDQLIMAANHGMTWEDMRLQLSGV